MESRPFPALGGMPKLPLNIWRNIKARVPQMETMLAALKELPGLMATTDGLEELSKTIENAEPQVAKLRRMVAN